MEGVGQAACWHHVYINGFIGALFKGRRWCRCLKRAVEPLGLYLVMMLSRIFKPLLQKELLPRKRIITFSGRRLAMRFF